MIKFAIQDSNVKDEHVDKLIDACIDLRFSYECFGRVPFTDTLTGDIVNDTDNIIIPFGEVKLIEMYNRNKLPDNWKIFYNSTAFRHDTMVQESILLKKLLLNGDAALEKFPECRNDTYWIDKFIKPVNDLKLFNGQILPAHTSLEDLLNRQTVDSSIFDKSENIIIADNKDIIDEFRVFVVNGKVITKSLYKHGNRLVGGFSYKFSKLENFLINFLSLFYQPAKAYCVDICTTKGRFGRNWHILEYNALQCSGFYNCDVQAILKTLLWHVHESC